MYLQVLYNVCHVCFAVEDDASSISSQGSLAQRCQQQLGDFWFISYSSAYLTVIITYVLSAFVRLSRHFCAL